MPDLDAKGLEAAAKASLAGLDCPGDPTDLWLAATEAAVRAYLAAVVPVTPTTENHDTVEWLRSTSREFASHGFRSCDVSLLDAERVARAERERGFAAGRAAATPPLHGTGYCPQPCPECAAATPDPPDGFRVTVYSGQSATDERPAAVSTRYAGATDLHDVLRRIGLEWKQADYMGQRQVVVTVDPVAHAASPDERLREALAFYADKGNYTAQNPVGSGAHVWRDMGGRARSALAAADRPQPPADERLREAAQVAVFACLPVLHIVGSQNRGYRVSDVIDPKVIADPQEWVDAAHAICELHHVLAAADRDSGDVAIERLGNAVIEANRRGPIPPVSDDPDFLAADREKPDAGPDGEDLP